MKARDASRITEYALGNLAVHELRALEQELAASDELGREAATVREGSPRCMWQARPCCRGRARAPRCCRPW